MTLTMTETEKHAGGELMEKAMEEEKAEEEEEEEETEEEEKGEEDGQNRFIFGTYA